MSEGRLAVVIRPLANSPELSVRIGYLASQQEGLTTRPLNG